MHDPNLLVLFMPAWPNGQGIRLRYFRILAFHRMELSGDCGFDSRRGYSTFIFLCRGSVPTHAPRPARASFILLRARAGPGSSLIIIPPGARLRTHASGLVTSSSQREHAPQAQARVQGQLLRLPPRARTKDKRQSAPPLHDKALPCKPRRRSSSAASRRRS